jgi:hypothetical protein
VGEGCLDNGLSGISGRGLDDCAEWERAECGCAEMERAEWEMATPKRTAPRESCGRCRNQGRRTWASNCPRTHALAAHKHGCNLSQPQMRVHARTGAHPRRAHVQSFARRYEATLWAAVSNAAAGGSRIVLLTLLGGGVFGSSFANRRR